MKNKLLLVIVAALIVGCADKVEYETALKDPITLNLVKQSIVDYKTIQQNQWVHSYDNGCSFTLVGFFTIPDKPIACDALDLRLNNKGIAVSASSLVSYYMNEQAEERENSAGQRIKDDAAAKQLLIENMANGK